MMDYGSNSGGWGFWLLMSLVMLLFWAVVIGLGVVAYRHYRAQHRSVGPAVQGHGQALQILDDRFARGEIDEDEYKHRRELLEVG
jgi:putative membrane protein